MCDRQCRISSKEQSVEALSGSEKIARQVGCWPGRTVLQMIMEINAAKKMYAKYLLKEVAEATSLGKEWLNKAPHREGPAMLRENGEYATAMHDGAKSDQGG